MAAQPSSTIERSKFDGVRMSLADYERLEEEKPYLEYWDGVVVQKGVPKRGHLCVADEMLAALWTYKRTNGGMSGPSGHVWFEGKGYRVPDISYWGARKRIDDGDRLLPPTLAVEIRSLGQFANQQRRKCQEMCVEGVDECWLVDPEERWIEVIARDQPARRLSPDAVIESPNMPGFSLPVAQLWAELDR